LPGPAMDRSVPLHSQRALDMLESLLQLPAGDLKATLTHVADLLAHATGADKVDAFLYDPARDSLVAIGTSTQPLSALERKLGLDVLPLANRGCAVHAFQSGKTFFTGNLEAEAGELVGVKEALGVRSTIGVALDVGGERRGLLLLASQKPDFFTQDNARFVESIASWVGVVAHRAELVEAIGRSAAEAGRRAGAEELVTVLAHDLRNYLSPLSLRLQSLGMRARSQGRDEDLADVGLALRAVQRLAGLISDILDVARIDRGIFQLRLETVDLAALAREAGGALAGPEQPVHVTVQQDSRVCVHGDPARLRQCLDNIIANAVQKSPRRVAVSIFVRREPLPSGGASAVVEVIDEGPGIPEDILPHVFEPFVTGRAREGGLGLGLYLAKQVAALHDGDLAVKSAPGKGARFILSLPALPA
jgi:two-component system, OmpR family, sensor kinase